MFNTLRFAKKLEEVGIPRNQAEAHVQIIAEIIEGDLTTKQDLKNVETNLRQDLNNLETNLRQDIKDIRDEMVKLEYHLVIKLGALVTVIIATAVTLLKIH